MSTEAAVSGKGFLNRNKSKDMRKFIVSVLFVTMCSSCQSKEEGSIENLQESICELSNVANKIDHDIESLWAYGMADSIAKTMELKEESTWRDLARAYSALSYIGYGMSYVRTVRHGDPDLLQKLTEVVAECDPDTVMPKKSLHLLELKADFSFIYFYSVSNMEAAESMIGHYENYSNMLDSIYSSNDLDGFKQFQSDNKCFFFVYAYMLSDLILINSATEEEYKKKWGDVTDIANEMDSLPEEWEERLSRQIELRARLIGMLSDEIRALE